MVEMREVAVIGAGPSGIAASIYLKRAGLVPLIMERADPGGLLRSANLVENYPGFPDGVTGLELASRFVQHLVSLGVRVMNARVMEVSRIGKIFEIESDRGRFASRALIVATGTRARRIGIEGASALEGSRLFYDIEEALLGGGDRTIIVGGGDAAFDYALNLSNHGKRVMIVSRSPPRSLPLLRERVKEKSIIVHVAHTPERVYEEGDSVVLLCRSRDGLKEFRGDAVLIACGRTPNLEPLGPDIRDALREAPIPETGIPGLYLVGDVARGAHRQTGIAVGDGIMAAMLVVDYLKEAREVE